MATTQLKLASMGLRVQAAIAHWMQRVTGHSSQSPEAVLFADKNMDPRLVPRTPMSSTEIDANLLVELGKMGMKRGKLVTSETHPELMAQWQVMSERAGLPRAPQLIVVDSDVTNAMTVTPQEVVITTGLLKKLDFRETCAVLGHELGHANSDHNTPRIAAKLIFSVAGAMAALRLWSGRGSGRVEHSVLNELGHDVLAISVGASAGNIVANQISVKPTELQADIKGAMISGDPEGLISALKKLDQQHKKNPLLDAFLSLQSGYPSTEQRIKNLSTMAAHMPTRPLPEPLVAAPASDDAAPKLTVVAEKTANRLEEAEPSRALAQG